MQSSKLKKEKKTMDGPFKLLYLRLASSQNRQMAWLVFIYSTYKDHFIIINAMYKTKNV